MLYYHQLFGAMINFAKKVPDIFTKIFIGGSLLIILLYSPSLLLEIPFFKIKRVELNVEDAVLRKKIESIINKNYRNNWIFLKISERKFENLLQKKTDFWIEHAEILAFNPLTGILHVKLELNKPIFSFNKVYFLSQKGRIFKVKNQNLNLPLLIDKTNNWKLGDFYDKLIINQLLEIGKFYSLKFVNVKPLKIFLATGKINFILPKKGVNKIQLTNYVTKFLPRKKLSLNFFGKKSVAVKIYKE